MKKPVSPGPGWESSQSDCRNHPPNHFLLLLPFTRRLLHATSWAESSPTNLPSVPVCFLGLKRKPRFRELRICPQSFQLRPSLCPSRPPYLPACLPSSLPPSLSSFCFFLFLFSFFHSHIFTESSLCTRQCSGRGVPSAVKILCKRQMCFILLRCLYSSGKRHMTNQSINK